MTTSASYATTASAASAQNDPLAALTAAGVSVWLDDLSRRRLSDGSLVELVRDRHLTGITTNPTIFASAITGSDAYTHQLRDLARRRVDVGEALRAVTSWDVRAGCDVLRPAYEATGHVDGRVSIEVDPRISHDTDATVAEARALWWLVDRPNLFIKIPATVKGLPAITQCLAEGISINVTLIFSLARYQAVIEAFLEGVERYQAAGGDLPELASVASFFVSRVDTDIDARLAGLGGDQAEALRGKAAIANARLAYQLHEQTLGSTRWMELAAAGARPQRPLWASTGVKNPAYPDTRYVTELVAPGTVNTMPEPTLNAVYDHGEVPCDSMSEHYSEARAVLDQLADLGVDYDDVVDTLEREAITKFETSWNNLAETVNTQLTELAGQTGVPDQPAAGLSNPA